MGQTNIALSYHRRRSALDGVMKSTIEAKSMLKNKSELLQKENKGLFGKGFREHISETVKAHIQSERPPAKQTTSWGAKFLQAQQ